CARDPEQAQAVLRDLWLGEESPDIRLQRFLTGLPQEHASGIGGRASTGSWLLMGVDVHNYPVYRVTPFHKGFRLTKFHWPDQGLGESAIYPHALEFLDQILEEAAVRDLVLIDRLDAQSVLWAVTAWTTEHPP